MAISWTYVAYPPVHEIILLNKYIKGPGHLYNIQYIYNITSQHMWGKNEILDQFQVTKGALKFQQ